MPILLVHKLDHEFNLKGQACVADFASQAILLDQQLTNGNQSIQRYDAARSVINRIESVDPRSMSTLILFENAEFGWELPIFDLFCKEVRWAERFRSVIILHNTEPPKQQDGVLICYKGTSEQLGNVSEKQSEPARFKGDYSTLEVETGNDNTQLLTCVGNLFIRRETFGSAWPPIPTAPLLYTYADGRIAKPIG